MKRFLAAGLLAGLLLTACGGSGTSATTASPSSPVPSSPTPTPSTIDTAAALAAYEACQGQLGDFVSALHDLNSRLDVGLVFRDYGERVGDVKVAYDQVPFKDMDPACLAVGIPAEAALNEYIKSENIWNDCITSPTCTNDSITSKLQGHWSKASSKIALVDKNLDAIKAGTAFGS